MSMGSGGIGREGSNFHKSESFSCQIKDVELFDEAKFIEALKISVKNDLEERQARIISSKNADATSFNLEYALDDVTGTVAISATKAARFYTLEANLNETSKDGK